MIGHAKLVLRDLPCAGDFLPHAGSLNRAIRRVFIREVNPIAELPSGERLTDLNAVELLEAFLLG
jgi:hypothetical protein